MATKQSHSNDRVSSPVDPADVEGGIGRTELPVKDRAGVGRGIAGSKPEHGRAVTVDEDYVGNAGRGGDVVAGDR
jgi:hypothetical protein